MTAFDRSIRRRGFSWVEVVVVLVILMFLVALLLPAVQESREAARRTQCKNNLKQMGLALHNYHDVHKTFPFGFEINTNGPYLGWSWELVIMPYLDCSPFTNGVDFGSGLQNEYANSDLSRQMPVYLCPSDKSPTLLSHAPIVTSNVSDGLVTPATVDAADTFSRSTYFGVAGYLQADVGGIEHGFSGDPPKSEPFINAGSLGNFGTSFSTEHRYCDPQNFRGVFGQNSFVKIEDIKDGTSNAIMVGERYVVKNTSMRSVGHGMWLGVPDCSNPAGLAMVLGDTSLKINAGFKTHAQSTGFGSEHIGGGQFLLCDGSVRFLSEQINIGTYRDLSTIDDQREIADF